MKQNVSPMGKSIIALVLAVCLLLPLAACGRDTESGGSGGTGGSTSVQGKTLREAEGTVYMPEYIQTDAQGMWLSVAGLQGDTLYVNYSKEEQDENGEYTYTSGIGVMKTDGTGFTSIWEGWNEWEEDVETGAYSSAAQYMSYTAAAPDGLVGLLSEYAYSYDPDGPWENEESYRLVLLGPDGTIQREADVAELYQSKEEYMWVYRLDVLSDGRVLLAMEDVAILLDEDWSVQWRAERSGYADFVVTGDDRVLVSEWDYETEDYAVQELNLETGESIDLEDDELGALSFYGAVPGVEYDLYVNDSSRLMGLDLDTGERTVLFEWMDMDVVYGYGNYAVSDEGDFYFFNEDNYGSQQELIRLSKRAAADIPERIELTYGCLYADYQVKEQIVEFNKRNEEYRIRVREYMDWMTYDYDEAILRLNADLMSGNVPDILEMSSLPYEQYARRGMLADIGALIDEDETINREDLVENVISLLELDGTLYTLMPGFNLQTLVGHPQQVGEEMGWTMEEFLDTVAGQPEGSSVFGPYLTREEFITYMMGNNLGQFIDRESGTCDFDSQLFMDYLDFAATLPETYDWETEGDVAYASPTDLEEYEEVNPYATGQILLMQDYISGFDALGWTRYQFGGEVTLKGFPNEERKNCLLMPESLYGISANTEHPDIVWSFVRTFLTEEYQRENVYNLPTNRTVMAEKMADAMEIPEYYSEEEAEMYREEGYPLAATQEDVDLILEMIEHVDLLAMQEQSVIEIINDEAPAYFAGDKTLEETVKIIQNRVQTYISENR